MHRLWPAFVLGLTSLASSGCSHKEPGTPVTIGQPPPLTFEGIRACSDDPNARVTLDPQRPVSVLVHGCFSSGGRFKALAEVFDLNGQQALCFNYDDRQKLTTAAQYLRQSLQALENNLQAPITVLGHSQGGLIAREALTQDYDATYPLTGEYRLVTVSSPFNGIAAANHCGLWPLHVVSLGITVGICQSITGSKWNQIHSHAALVRSPSPLSQQVEHHFALITDERGSCRRRDQAGTCKEDDFVFSVDEQHNQRFDQDRVDYITLQAGHVEVVGEEGAVPRKLLTTLEDIRVLETDMRAPQTQREHALRGIYAQRNTASSGPPTSVPGTLPARSSSPGKIGGSLGGPLSASGPQTASTLHVEADDSAGSTSKF